MAELKTEAIEAVGIDEEGSLWVEPAHETFEYIWREAMEVHWDETRGCLYGPKPREWSYAAWFEQILAAAREQGVPLELASGTSWLGIEPRLKQAILDRFETNNTTMRE